ncbi:MAG: hypothetical protein KAW12_26920 [Candidatus Aminicenantes bacterium]|nr:hypothetical protein [Candidatus Aminicenantes bacterium]
MDKKSKSPPAAKRLIAPPREWGITGWLKCKWVFIGVVLAGAFLFFFFSNGPIPSEKKVPKKEIVRGWAKMSGNKQGKVIFAQPPKMMILNLKTGITKEVPGVITEGECTPKGLVRRTLRRLKGPLPRGYSPRPSWSPDGKRFLYRYKGSIYACDEQGNKKKIKNNRMDCSYETRWSWRVENGEDWALGPSKKGNVIQVKINDPTVVKTVYAGGDVVKHCEMTGTGTHIVYARKRDIFVAAVGSKSKEESRKISHGQSCRPCAAPDNRVAWLPVPHERYFIHDATSGKETGVLHAPPPPPPPPKKREIYRLNWSNHPDFAVHMYGSECIEYIHVRRISTGEHLFIGSGWDPDLWIEIKKSSG